VKSKCEIMMHHSAQIASDTADMRVTVKATRAQAELIYLLPFNVLIDQGRIEQVAGSKQGMQREISPSVLTSDK